MVIVAGETECQGNVIQTQEHIKCSWFDDGFSKIKRGYLEVNYSIICFGRIKSKHIFDPHACVCGIVERRCHENRVKLEVLSDNAKIKWTNDVIGKGDAANKSVGREMNNSFSHRECLRGKVEIVSYSDGCRKMVQVRGTMPVPYCVGVSC